MSLRLTVSNISKGYDGNFILKECSFSFLENGVYTLMGPNGCGKSTFLRICSLLERPDSGEVTYRSDGKVVEKGMELKRKITLVLPSVGVFNTTVFGNVAYGLKIRGVSKKTTKDKVCKVLEFAGLLNKRQQNALTLSSGETQRLGIARALAIDPEILFLDEPTASVDHKNGKIIEDIILKMKDERRTMIVLATHDKEQAARLADFFLVMKDGRIGAEKSG